MYYARKLRLQGLGDDTYIAEPVVVAEEVYTTAPRETQAALRSAQYGLSEAIGKQEKLRSFLEQLVPLRIDGVPSVAERNAVRVYARQRGTVGDLANKVQALKQAYAEARAEALKRAARLQAEAQQRAEQARAYRELQARIEANRVLRQAEAERVYQELQERVAANDALLRARARDEALQAGEILAGEE